MAREKPVYTLADLESVPRIEFEHFTKEDAFQLGTTAAQLTLERGLNLAVDIVIGEDLVYRAKLGRTGPGNDEWLSGKAAVARHFREPSLLVRRQHEAAGTPFESLDFDHDRMKAHGGSVPIFVGRKLVATITMSGEPDVVDHETVTEALRRYALSLHEKLEHGH